MKKFTRGAVAAFVLMIPMASASTAAEGPWEKLKDEAGITVYGRTVEGSSLKEFRAEALIDATMEVVNNVLCDVPTLKDWMPSTIVAELLHLRGFEYAVMYQQMKSPWPVANRDFLYEIFITRTPDSIIRVVRAIDHIKFPRYAPRPGVVRVNEMSGGWELLRRGKATRVVYHMRSNPGGSLPAWLANSASSDLPFKTILGLKTKVKEPKYRSAAWESFLPK
jgi:hypothetical protein